jgi:dienelactone hydrolase
MRMAIFARTVMLALMLTSCASTPLDKFPSAEGDRIPGSRARIFIPEGAGSHPAIVMLHTCGGISPHLNMWTERLVGAGYVVLKVDSFGPRGVGSVCDQWGVSVDQVAADALAAAQHLRKLPFVDHDRIAVVGFSYGAMAGLRLASASYLKRQQYPVPFRAVVAFYPFCTPVSSNPALVAVQDNFYFDIATPVHLLLGGADNEAPSALCASHAEGLIKAGQPVSYTVMAGATHAFDMDLPSKGYRYNQEAVDRAWVEMREFLARCMK